MADVAIEVEGRLLPTPIEYQIDIDLLTPADALSFTVPLDAATLAQVPLDGEVTAYIDDAAVLSGFIETTDITAANTIEVSALCRCGRLVAESVDGAGFSVLGERLSRVLARVAGPWFSSIVFSNARDRRLRIGRGRKARAGQEPALTLGDRLASVQRIEAGTARWTALERIARALQLLAWSSGDGTSLVVARPQYDQEPQYEFFETRAASNVTALTLSRSVAGRYAQVEVSGSGFPPGISPPPQFSTTLGIAAPRFVSRNKIGAVLDGPNPDGTGLDFRHPKRLFVVSEAISQAEAQIEAQRWAARARAKARVVSASVPNHGQIRQGTQYRSLYTVDTVARIIKTIDAAPGDDGEFELLNAPLYTTRVTYRGSRDAEETALEFVPLGTLLL